MLEVHLVVTGGARKGHRIRVPKADFVIGRGDECHLQPKSESVSRRHCALLISRTHVALRDFGSKNGTYLNGERVEGYLLISPGDILKVGPLEFEVSFKVPVDATEADIPTVPTDEPEVPNTGRETVSQSPGQKAVETQNDETSDGSRFRRAESSEDSREAANDAIRRYFNRRL